MSEQPTNPNSLNIEETAVIVESSEANMFRAVWDGVLPRFAAEYGASWQEVGGATATNFERLPITAFNRAVGSPPTGHRSHD